MPKGIKKKGERESERAKETRSENKGYDKKIILAYMITSSSAANRSAK